MILKLIQHCTQSDILIPLAQRLALASQPTLPQRYTTTRAKNYKNPEKFKTEEETHFEMVVSRLIDWLIDCQIVWLFDWLIDC